eukprot:g22002.t1
MPNFLRHLRKKWCCYAFLTVTSLWEVQDRLSVIITEELDALHPLNFSSVDVDGGMFSSFLSEVNDQFFSFADVEGQIVFIAP